MKEDFYEWNGYIYNFWLSVDCENHVAFVIGSFPQVLPFHIQIPRLLMENIEKQVKHFVSIRLHLNQVDDGAIERAGFFLLDWDGNDDTNQNFHYEGSPSKALRIDELPIALQRNASYFRLDSLSFSNHDKVYASSWKNSEQPKIEDFCPINQHNQVVVQYRPLIDIEFANRAWYHRIFFRCLEMCFCDNCRMLIESNDDPLFHFDWKYYYPLLIDLCQIMQAKLQSDEVQIDWKNESFHSLELFQANKDIEKGAYPPMRIVYRKKQMEIIHQNALYDVRLDYRNMAFKYRVFSKKVFLFMFNQALKEEGMRKRIPVTRK